MRRYAVSSSASVSSAPNTTTPIIGLITGNGRMCLICDILAEQAGVVNDAEVRVDLLGVSSTLTAGSPLTPQPASDSGSSAPAATTGFSSAPTGVTTTGLSLLSLAFNSRATVHWSAVDPDSRIAVPAGGGAAGTLVVQNQQPGSVAGLISLVNLYFVE